MSSKDIKTPLGGRRKPLKEIPGALAELHRAAAEHFSKLPYFDEVNVRVASYDNPRIANAMKALDLTGDAPRGDLRLQSIKKRRDLERRKALDLTGDAPRGDLRLQSIKKRRDLERRIAEKLIQLEGRMIDGFVLVRNEQGWCRIIPISKEAA